jgi:glycosyltransferase involved in cell wall biosynthesis
LGRHGTTLPRDIPPNVRLVAHDGDPETWIAHIRGAKVVALPVLPETISSSGIGTYIDAMAMRKCVVMTEGVATRGLLSDQAVVVPPRDPEALAAAVRRAWEDASFREKVASAGRDYAERLAGEERLHRDVAREAVRLAAGNAAAAAWVL